MPRLAAVLLVTATTLVPAASAAAKAPSKAKILRLSGDGQVLRYGSDTPDGTVETSKVLHKHHVYRFDGVGARIRMGRTIYKATPGTIVSLSSYAASKSSPVHGALSLMQGRLDVKTTRKSPGGVMNEEGLYNPINPLRMRYRVARVLNTDDEISSQDIVAFFANFSDQRTGTTTVKSLDGHTVNVTPYVGSKPGTCRHADAATLKTTTRYGKGTASYKLSR